LPLAEWWYNTNIHASTKLSPFKAVYGYPPPPLLAHSPGTAAVQSVEDTLRSRDQILRLLRGNPTGGPREDEAFCRFKTY
jgi:hypothetical protein